MFSPHDWPGRRNRVGFVPNYRDMQFVNYSTELKAKMVEKNPEFYPPDDLLNHLNMLENPLQKNLADTIHTYDMKAPSYPEKSKVMLEEKIEMEESAYPSFAGIGSFFSGVFNMLTGGTFRRAKSPTFIETSNTNNCKSWPEAKSQAENTTCTQYDHWASQNNISAEENVKEEMADCKTAVAQCESKIARVKSLLASKTEFVKTSPRLRRPKKLFVQPNQVTKRYVEVPECEDTGLLMNDATIECICPRSNVTDGFTQVCGSKIKLEKANMTLDESKMDLVVPEEPEVNSVLESTDIVKPVEVETELKKEIISSCEDKMSQLKALISERRKNNRTVHDSSTESENSPNTKPKPIELKTHNRRYKNPNRITGGRIKTNLRKSIEEDMSFAQEIDAISPENSPKNSPIIENIPKMPPIIENVPQISPIIENVPQKLPIIENISQIKKKSSVKTELKESPNEFFNEITGRFHNNSMTDSEDSFQIVFTDSPQNSPRARIQSDCDSEDSFIVFEDHDCYTSTDVFGDQSDTDYSSEDELEGKISHAFSRTVSDLTDESLYEERNNKSTDEVDHVCDVMDKGLIIDEAKKIKRKDQPAKSVRFSDQPPKVHVLRVWSFAARQARKGNWEQCALDRDRFKRRIADADMAISWVLKPQHRSRVKFQRFMPWWHAQRRKEAAEKKIAEEKRKIEEAKRQKEEEERKIEELRLEVLRMEEEEQIRFDEEIRQIAEQKKRSNFLGRNDAIGIEPNIPNGEDENCKGVTQKLVDEEVAEDKEVHRISDVDASLGDKALINVYGKPTKLEVDVVNSKNGNVLTNGKEKPGIEEENVKTDKNIKVLVNGFKDTGVEMINGNVFSGEIDKFKNESVSIHLNGDVNSNNVETELQNLKVPEDIKIDSITDNCSKNQIVIDVNENFNV